MIRKKKRLRAFPEKPPAQPQKAQEQTPERSGRLDQPLLLLTLLLLALGLICLFSASYATAYDSKSTGYDPTYYITRQGFFAVGGVAAMLIISRVDYHKLHYLALPALVCAILVMATIKVPGLKNLWEKRNEAIRWIRVAGISFQPSELAKVAVILSFSSMASIFGKKKMHTLRYGILPFLAVIGIFAVELYWEKHLSGTAIIAVIGMLIIFMGGANLAWFGVGGVGLAAAAAWYIKTNEYAMTRIRVWLDPFSDYRNKGWQGSQSQIAIGSGGFWGLGLGQSRQKHLYLPEPANDFIFSVWCE